MAMAFESFCAALETDYNATVALYDQVLVFTCSDVPNMLATQKRNAIK
jgi:hypothetical protein